MKRYYFYVTRKKQFYEDDIFIEYDKSGNSWLLTEIANTICYQGETLSYNPKYSYNPNYYIKFPFHDKIKFDKDIKAYYVDLTDDEVMYIKVNGIIMTRYYFYCDFSKLGQKYETDIFLGTDEDLDVWYLTDTKHFAYRANPIYYINFPFADKVSFDDDGYCCIDLTDNEEMYLRLMS